MQSLFFSLTCFAFSNGFFRVIILNSEGFMEELKQEIKKVIISSLELEDIKPEDIVDSEPIFGEGLGLDSIDALELGVALKCAHQSKNLRSDMVDFGIDFSVLNSLGYVFYANNPTGLTGYEIGDGACAGIEVVNGLAASKTGKLAGNGVKVISLFGVGLIERLGTNLELQVFHQLEDVILTLECQNLLVADGVVALLVVQIE